jgi:ribonuclease P protein component
MAVERNRAKRRLREAIHPWIPKISVGWNLILIARQPILKAEWLELISAIQTLLNRACVIKKSDE